MSKSVLVLGRAGTAACSPPLSREPLSAEQAARVALLLKALADPVRPRLMSLIASRPGGEACVCDLNGALADPTGMQIVTLLARRARPMNVGELVAGMDTCQSTVSSHLKVLTEVPERKAQPW